MHSLIGVGKPSNKHMATEPKTNVSNCDEFEEPDGTHATTVTVSSDMRRTILGTATPYRISDELTSHHVVGSANFSVDKGGHTEIEIHPLSQLRESDPKWLQPREGVACFHCCHEFATVPVWIPQSLDSRGLYWVRPTPFCSLNCAKAHLVEMNSFSSSQQMMLLHRVARDIYGHRDDSIVSAPARQCLRLFGGVMSIEEFRAENQHASVNIETPPFTPLNMFIERSPHIRPVQPTTEAPICDQPRVCSSNWNVTGLRRPAVQQTLPRAQPLTAGPSMLQKFVDVKKSNDTWNASQFDAPRVVTSKTPSVQQVKDARNATLQQAQRTSGEVSQLRCNKTTAKTKRVRRPAAPPVSSAKASSSSLLDFVESADR